MDDRGMSLAELVVAATIVATVLSGIAAAGGLASRHLRVGQTDMDMWMAVQQQAEVLMAEPHEDLASGSAVVQGHPMTWTVTGDTLKKVVLVAEQTGLDGSAREDTMVLYRALRGS
jgi:hypothetical protein